MWFSKKTWAIYTAIAVVSATTTTPRIANFDDRKGSLVPAANAVEVYRSLLYKAFSISNKITGLGGVVAKSNPNFAVTSLLNGQTTQGTPTLTVDYPGSEATSFTFFSFYFGCVAPTVESAVGAAVQCSVLAAAFNSTNKEIAVASYTFTPPAANTLNAPLVQAVFPKTFTRLHNMAIVQTSPATPVLAVDDLELRSHLLLM
ncbi:MAG: hypothetical protein LQ346_002691, partial [Caloplaca aetnensis]